MKLHSLPQLTLFAVLLTPTSAPAQGPWTERYELAPPSPTAEAQFGTGVAIDGETLVVGAPQTDVALAGAAHVFEFSGGAWVHRQALTPMASSTTDHFGSAVAIDGDRLVVGAILAEGQGGQFQAGSVTVFVRTAGVWMEEARLVAPDGGFGDEFGRSVDISGERIAVGARLHDAGATNTGAVYVFALDAGAWAFEQKLVPFGAPSSEGFGIDVALSGDLLIGGSTRSSLVPGAAIVFVRDVGGWSQDAVLSAHAPTNGDRFGFSVDLEGSRAVIGAPHADVMATDAGAAYVFEREPSGKRSPGTVWVQRAELVARDGLPSDNFGDEVALGGDRIAVGAEHRDDLGQASGAAYLFELEGDVWMARAKATASDGFREAAFGHALAVQGERAVIGAYHDDDEAFNAGAVYVFLSADRPGTPVCLGTGCPCGNDDPDAGCVNSGGSGGRLEATGSISVAADDLRLVAHDAPAGNGGLLVVGSALLAPAMVGDGLACVGGSTHRYVPQSVGETGHLVLKQPVASAPAGFFVPGQTRIFQLWSRDVLCGPPPMPCPSPCMGGSNLTHGLMITMEP